MPEGPGPASEAGGAAARDGLPRSRSGVFDLATLLVLYLILAALLLIFVGGLAGTFGASPRTAIGLAGAVAALVTAGLSIYAIALILKLIKGSAGAQSASRLRTRLAWSFTLVSILSALPLGLLGWRALSAAASSWFDAGTVEALALSERLAMDFTVLMSDQIEAAARFDLPELAARRPPREAREILIRLERSRPGIASVQVFQGAAESSFAGDERFRASASAVASSADGYFPAISLDGAYALRHLSTPPEGGGRRYLLSMRFPGSWSRATTSMGLSLSRNRSIQAAIPGFRRAMALVFLAFMAPLVMAAAILGVSMADAFARPIAAIERATQRVAEGDMGARVLASPADDFAHLSLGFNRMLAEIDRFRAVLLQEEKENAWQDIARKLAHEMKNPLTPIRLSAERVLRRHRTDPASASEILEPSMLAIIQEVDGLSALLEDFKDFARLPEPQFEWTGLTSIFEDIARVYGQSHPAVSFALRGLDEPLTIKADPGHLRQLFVNLVSNAIDAMGGRGTVSISVDLVKYAQTHYCRVEVRDTGPGIPADLQARLFTPYFTTKENGTGLGLTIAEHIAMSHKGRIWFESEPGAGTAFYVDLPAESRGRAES